MTVIKIAVFYHGTKTTGIPEEPIIFAKSNIKNPMKTFNPPM
jgi:hypothetical protein